MSPPNSRTLLVVVSVSQLLRLDPVLAFSLKSCTVSDKRQSVSCQGRDLTAVPDDVPGVTTSLDLSSNRFSKINSTEFRRFSKLRSLRLSYNVISHIEDGAFANLVELWSLKLNKNLLTNLTDDMFQGLSGLVMISLYGNRISSISPLAFQPLIRVQTVNLGANRLQQITAVAPIFSLPSLQFLYLGYNQLDSFHSEALNVSHVRLLQLDMNPLRNFSVTTNVFPDLRSLVFTKCGADLEWNVPNKTFLGSVTDLFLGGENVSFDGYRAILQTLDSVQKLKMSQVKDGIIEEACRNQALTSLEVSNSLIGTINTQLKSCSQLRKLTLAANDLVMLSEDSLGAMTKIKLLNLDANKLCQLPRTVRGLVTLESLSLRNNFISELDCLDFQDLTSLTELRLDNNRISSLQGCVFENLRNLRDLQIGNNALSTFDSTFALNLHKLKTLNLHNSQFRQIGAGVFRNLSSLSMLDLESDTYYKVRDGAFEGLSSLQTLTLTLERYREGMFVGLEHLKDLTLHLTFNWKQETLQQHGEAPFSRLTSLTQLIIRVYPPFIPHVDPDVLRGLSSLECFIAEKFFSRSLSSDTFIHTPGLKFLQILDSGLSDLTPEIFQPIPNLQVLDLSRNKIRCLDFLSGGGGFLQALMWLQLSNNDLSVINVTTFQALPALTLLDLSGNPLTCECSNAAFQEWALAEPGTQVFNGHRYMCAFPVSQQGNTLLDFDMNPCWVDSNFILFISSTSLVLLTLATSFTYQFLRWHLVYTYYLLLAFIYNQTRRSRSDPEHHYDAFVSYNVHDEAWVLQEMLPVLEGEQGWRLCLHHRDFQPGAQ